MKKETLAISDFMKTQPAVFESGVDQEQKRTCDALPICHTSVKVTAKTIKFTKPRKVSAK